MAFGRSNSLSINTGATNSLFAQQNQNQNASQSQPQQGGGLFGGSLFGNNQQQQSQPNAGGSLFGSSTAASQPQQSGGLFGQTTTNQQNTGGSLFGNAGQQQTSQPQQGGSLFGNTGQQQGNQPQQGGGLFGGGGGSSLFGNTQSQQNKPQQAGGLFGSGGGLTSGAAQNQPGQNQQPTTSLFGGGSSLFGNNQQQQQAQQQQQQQQQGPNTGFGSSLFGNTQQPQPQSSLFGQRPNPQQPYSVFGAPMNQQPSLYQSALYNQSRASYAGKLSMGQPGQAGAPSAPQGQSAQTYDWNNVRGTTRFSDLRDDVKQELEKVDKMIQTQENLCAQIEAFIPKHGIDIESLGPDVDLITEKAEAMDAALTADAHGVQGTSKIVDDGKKDFLRCLRVLQNQQLPTQYQLPGPASLVYGSRYGSNAGSPDTGKKGRGVDDEYDTDLIGNYFLPMSQQLQSTLEAYSRNLIEIEQHVRIMESSSISQAQQLAAKRAGMSGADNANGEDTVQELADTLRGFEASILGAASAVGQCREGVNALVLGKLDSELGRRGR